MESLIRCRWASMVSALLAAASSEVNRVSQAEIISSSSRGVFMVMRRSVKEALPDKLESIRRIADSE